MNPREQEDQAFDQAADVQLRTPAAACQREQLLHAIAGLRHELADRLLGQTHDDHPRERRRHRSEPLDRDRALAGQLAIDQRVEQLGLLAQQLRGAEHVCLGRRMHRAQRRNQTRGSRRRMTRRIRIQLRELKPRRPMPRHGACPSQAQQPRQTPELPHSPRRSRNSRLFRTSQPPPRWS